MDICCVTAVAFSIFRRRHIATRAGEYSSVQLSPSYQMLYDDSNDTSAMSDSLTCMPARRDSLIAPHALHLPVPDPTSKLVTIPATWLPISVLPPAPNSSWTLNILSLKRNTYVECVPSAPTLCNDHLLRGIVELPEALLRQVGHANIFNCSSFTIVASTSAVSLSSIALTWFIRCLCLLGEASSSRSTS